MEITAERLKYLQDLSCGIEKTCVPPFLPSAVKKEYVKSFYFSEKVHRKYLQTKPQKLLKKKQFPKLWRTVSKEFRYRYKSTLPPQLRVVRKPKAPKPKADQRRYTKPRFCPCGNHTRVTKYEATLLSPERIYYGNRCSGCIRIVRRNYKYCDIV